MNNCALACGRFQPFHNDHLEYVLTALASTRFLWIGITKPFRELNNLSESHREIASSNPYNFVERYQMIRNSLIECGISLERFAIIPLDFENPVNFRESCPKDVPVYITVTEQWSLEKKRKFEQLGLQVEILFEKMNPKITGTRIRQLIETGDTSWEKFVPPAVRVYIERVCHA